MRILMITSCFAPKNVIGAVRLSKMAKYLIKDGCELTVISPVLEDYDAIDSMLECVELEKATRITIPYSRITARLTRSHKKESGRKTGSQIGNQVNATIKARIYRNLRSVFSWWRDWEWTAKVNRCIRSLPGTFDAVLSSYPNASAHDSAYYAKKTGKAAKWIADFRDPLVLESSSGRERKRKVKRQSKIVERADLTTHVSKAGVERFVCSPSDRKKVIWVPNGFDEDDFASIDQFLDHREKTASNQLVFSYAGGMYGGERDCSPLFKAIKELIDEGKLTQEDVRVDYAGRDYGILKSQADRYGVSVVIRDNGLIPRKESIELQAASDCVIVSTFCYTDNGGAMTGKIYEPIMMRKPIMMLVGGPGKNSEPGAFVRYLNAGIVYEDSIDRGDVTKIKESIIGMINEKQAGSIRSAISEEKRDEYNYRNIMDGLLKQMIG